MTYHVPDYRTVCEDGLIHTITTTDDPETAVKHLDVHLEVSCGPHMVMDVAA